MKLEKNFRKLGRIHLAFGSILVVIVLFVLIGAFNFSTPRIITEWDTNPLIEGISILLMVECVNEGRCHCLPLRYYFSSLDDCLFQTVFR